MVNATRDRIVYVLGGIEGFFFICPLFTYTAYELGGLVCSLTILLYEYIQPNSLKHRFVTRDRIVYLLGGIKGFFSSYVSPKA